MVGAANGWKRKREHLVGKLENSTMQRSQRGDEGKRERARFCLDFSTALPLPIRAPDSRSLDFQAAAIFHLGGSPTNPTLTPPAPLVKIRVHCGQCCYFLNDTKCRETGECADSLGAGTGSKTVAIMLSTMSVGVIRIFP